jgi:hypothetical protein
MNGNASAKPSQDERWRIARHNRNAKVRIEARPAGFLFGLT